MIATIETDANNPRAHYVKLTSVETGDPIRFIDAPPKSEIEGLAFSDDGKYLAYGSARTISLCSPGTGKELCRIKTAAIPKLLIFSPDSKTIVAKGNDRSFRLFDIESSKALRQFGETISPAGTLYYPGVDSGRSLCFSRDSKSIAAGDRNTVRFWETAPGD
jgi:WD40 repeat protein